MLEFALQFSFIPLCLGLTWRYWSHTPKSSGIRKRNQKKNKLVSKCVQLCPTFCDPMDCNLPGSCVHGISQVRILEWVAISCSRDQTGISGSPALAGRFWTTNTSWKAQSRAESQHQKKQKLLCCFLGGKHQTGISRQWPPLIFSRLPLSQSL